MQLTEPARLAAPGRAAGRARVPLPVVLAIGVAWVLAIGAQAGGRAGALGHDHLVEDGGVVALGLFLVAWQAMIAAMMLPSSLPLVRLFSAVSAQQERPGFALGAFLAGYAVVWSAFGAAALLLDAMVHEAVHRAPGLEARPWLVTGGILALAGAFQFSSLKDRCLNTCRHPAAYLLPRYRRGTGSAFRLGRDHGLFCLGCCWALMLLMFAAGVANLAWMAVLTAVMVYEKVGRHGRALTPVVGWALLGWAVLVLTTPGAH